jgi:hypothetical protein
MLALADIHKMNSPKIQINGLDTILSENTRQSLLEIISFITENKGETPNVEGYYLTFVINEDTSIITFNIKKVNEI